MAGLTVRAGGLLPPLRLDAQALREERAEDARLLLTEPRQLAQVGHQLVARRRARPDPAGITVVLLDDAPAQLLGAIGHRGREAVQRGALLEHLSQLVGVA